MSKHVVEYKPVKEYEPRTDSGPLSWVLLIIGGIVLIGGLFFVTTYITKVCIPYTAKADKIEKTLYSSDEDMDQVDVCLIGGSHGINAFNPNILWESAGLHSYNYCYAGENIALSKLYLEELYKKRDFELVVLDLYYTGLDDKYFGEKDYAFDVMNKMGWSLGKLDYVKNHVSEQVRKDFYFPLRRYHSRWCELDDKDIERKPDLTDDYKLGQDYHYEVNDGTEVSFLPWFDSGQVMAMKDDIEKELRGFIELAKDHGSQVLLVDIPRRYNDSLMPAKWVGDEYAVVNRAKQIAAEYDVKVLQYNDEELEKIGFDPHIHMYNKGHMNVEGSEIFSRALGEYIIENYDVSRHPRTAMDIWEGYLVQYQQKKKEEYGE